MPSIKLHNVKNEEIGDLTLPDAVFGVKLNEALIHAAVKNYMANQRHGTVGTKTRGNVSGSGRKLWKQKGTGRARIASIRSPLWKGGGNVHGPQPRDWSYSLPKKMRRGALRSALSERVREGNLIVVDEFVLAQPKTKEFVQVLGTLGLAGKTLIVESSSSNVNLHRASRNIQRTKIVRGSDLNIYDLLYHEKLVMSRDAVEEISRLLEPPAKKSSINNSSNNEATESNEAAQVEEGAA